MRDQIKRVNFYLLSLFTFLIIFNVFSFAYSQQQSTNVSAPTTYTQQKIEERKDIVEYVFDNSVTTMLLSTFIIAIIGTLISKMRNLKKKLDMIEILTKSQVKMKQMADDREKNFERRFIESNNAVAKQIGDLCEKMDRKTEQLEDKIDDVERNATASLIKYLSENSLNRKR